MNLQISVPFSDHYCLLHRREKVSHICVDSRCTNNPFLCHQCLNENIHKLLHANHQECISTLSQSLVPLAQLVESQKANLQNIYDGSIGNIDYIGVIKRVQMAQKHYQAMETHIKTVKHQVQKEIEIVTNQINKRILNYKQNLFLNLDNYIRQYIQNFESFKAIAQPIISFNRKYKNYSNPNNLSIKLSMQTKQRSSDWYIDLKRVMATTSKILQRSQQYYNSLSKSSIYIKQMMDEIPQIHHPQKLNITLSVVDQILSNLVSLKQLKSLQNVLNQGERTQRKQVNGVYRQSSIH